jgi:hypothetical protein
VRKVWKSLRAYLSKQGEVDLAFAANFPEKTGLPAARGAGILKISQPWLPASGKE